MLAIAQCITEELNLHSQKKVKITQVEAAIKLIEEGATVPFIARYRKEATGGLDDAQLRLLEERLVYLQELNERREVIINSIKSQDKLTPALEKALLAVTNKTQLEDLYLPYKPTRTSKAKTAREAGLEPLANGLLNDPNQDPIKLAEKYINADKAINNHEEALLGAREILIDQFATHAALLNELREYVWQHAILTSEKIENKKKEKEAEVFKDYFEYQEALKKIPSHRALALFRGRKLGFLRIKLLIDSCEQKIADQFNIENKQRAADSWLLETVEFAWKQKLSTKIECELLARLKEQAEEGAIQVFAENLRDILLAAPAGEHTTMGLDPGIRTGVKVVVVDHTGKLLEQTTIYPFAPSNERLQSIAMLAKLAGKFKVKFMSVGNGTASRETMQLVDELATQFPALNITKVMVSEAGASVYSASALAAQEFPDLDVSLRGAVSIARRLQDPLAELVKIEPKSLGVGQYQHDVNQNKLKRCLEHVVEDCVNHVGVDLNTASAPLLKKVAGLSESLANNIVSHREEHGAFSSREQLLSVARMGEKSYQQAAGFLRIRHGENPLDATGVHPESYPIVQHILEKNEKSLEELLNNSRLLKAMNAADYSNDQWGVPTIQDILHELEKPGRDPRPSFRMASFEENVNSIQDLNEGMILEGVVSNVTNFGAFVDIGVHQDGLVHISELANQFVDDPRKVIKAGDIVKVKVIEVEKSRKRIGLSIKQALAPKQSAPQKPEKNAAGPKSNVKKTKKPATKKPVVNSAMADALSQLKISTKES